MYSGGGVDARRSHPPFPFPALVRHSFTACRLVDLTVQRLAPAGRESARRALHRRRSAVLLGRARAGTRRRVALGVPLRSAAREARRELALGVAEVGWRDELARVADDVLDRHAARLAACAPGPGGDSWDAHALVERLAHDALVEIARLTGLLHAASEVPAVAVRAALECAALPVPDGADFVAMLDRAGDLDGHRALEHHASAILSIGPGLVPTLAHALVRAAARADGFDVDERAVRDAYGHAVDRAAWHSAHALHD